ncbi:MAG: helix-turn-helix transcriptional regulator [Bacteroidales bacterium]|nr:helix-turn-helix transcriptional regulator [Bacteroidales bacterium]
MTTPSLSPRLGNDTLRVGNSDDLVFMEHFGTLPKGPIRLLDHGIFFYCTEGQAQFDYDGQRIELHKGDLYLYHARCTVENMMASADFDCREIWFSRSAMWDMNITGKKSILDLVALKQHPKISLFDDEIALLDDYFRLLGRRMRESSSEIQKDVVHAIFGAMSLDMLGMIRRGFANKDDKTAEKVNKGSMNALHGKQLADRYVKLVEDCDGRIRRVEEFARMLNVSPRYLIRQLKETLDRTPREIIALFTGKAIEYRLRFTDMTMQQIADDLHFASASFFGRYVKEHFGMTPMEYRTKLQGKQE